MVYFIPAAFSSFACAMPGQQSQKQTDDDARVSSVLQCPGMEIAGRIFALEKKRNGLLIFAGPPRRPGALTSVKCHLLALPNLISSLLLRSDDDALL